MNQKHKILAVDDNEVNLSIMEEILSETYHLRTAANGEQALVMAHEFRPDVILLDIMMDGIDGYEVCRKLKNDPKMGNPKIIMVSAKAMVSERLKGYETGADDYITKPFEEYELIAKLKVYTRLKFIEEIDQLKDSILTLLSHETRTPMNQILGMAGILCEQNKMPDDERKGYAQVLLDSAQNLCTLIKKVNCLIDIKADRFTLSYKNCGLNQIIQNAAKNNQSSAGKKSINIILDINPDIELQCDCYEVEQVITAMINNAIRFSEPGQQIQISAGIEESDAFIKITDQGSGIPKEFLPHVFDEFTDSDSEHHSQGHGLSMAIAREIINMHGGSISVTSKPQKETTFTIHLPVQKNAEAILTKNQIPR